MDDALKEYRQYLIETLQKVSESYDKTILSLSGGALGISFTFIKDFIGDNQVTYPYLLFISWVLLSISLASVLLSLFFGTLAFREAIKQVDNATIYERRTGGKWGTYTIILHSTGAVFLLIGLLFMGGFVYANIGVNDNGKKAGTTATAPTPGASTSGSRSRQNTGGPDSPTSACSPSPQSE